MAPMCEAVGLVKEKSLEQKKPHVSLKSVRCVLRRNRVRGDNTALRRKSTFGAAQQSSPCQNDSVCCALHSKCACVWERDRESTAAPLNSLSLGCQDSRSVATQGFHKGHKDDATRGHCNAIRANRSTGKDFQDTRKNRGRVSGSGSIFTSVSKVFLLTKQVCLVVGIFFLSRWGVSRNSSPCSFSPWAAKVSCL